MGNRKFALVLILMVFSVCFILGEVMTRYLEPQSTYSFFKESFGEHYRAGGFIPFTLKPDSTATPRNAQKEGEYYNIKINNVGLRGEDISYEKPRGTRRVLVVGDSLTFGLYVENDETYPSVLESMYAEEGAKIQVLNAGYAGGWSPDEHYAWLLNEGLKFNPDVIIYGFYVGNDIDWINESGWAELNSKGLPTKIVNEKHLCR